MKDLKYYVDNLNVLFEDNHVLVCEKYTNVLSQGDETKDISMVDIVKEYLKVKYNKPGNVYLGLIHRLDRRVGGVMVFAKTSKAAARLSKSIQDNEFGKHYIAMVDGILDKDGEINIKLLKKDNIAIVSNDGKDSSLTYKVIKSSNDKTLVDINLITGRYNQIRASFSYINHPIINDYKYSKLYERNNNDLGLYCYSIKFPHPITKELIEVKLDPTSNIWNI